MKKFIIICLMVFTLNSYASDCSDAFNTTNKSRTTDAVILEVQKKLELGISIIKDTITGIVANETAISPKSKKFDTFTRDSLLLIILQEIKKRFEDTSNLEKTPDIVDNLIITINNTTKNKQKLKQSNVLKALQEIKSKLEKSKLTANEAVKILEKHIEELNTELTKPSNKNKSIDIKLDDLAEELIEGINIIEDFINEPTIEEFITEAVKIFGEHTEEAGAELNKSASKDMSKEFNKIEEMALDVLTLFAIENIATGVINILTSPSMAKLVNEFTQLFEKSIDELQEIFNIEESDIIDSDDIIAGDDLIIAETKELIDPHSSSKNMNQEDQTPATLNNKTVTQGFKRTRNNITEYNNTSEGQKNPINSVTSYDRQRDKLPQDDVSGKSSSVLRKLYREHISEDGTAKGFSNYLLSKNT